MESSFQAVQVSLFGFLETAVRVRAHLHDFVDKPGHRLQVPLGDIGTQRVFQYPVVSGG